MTLTTAKLGLSFTTLYTISPLPCTYTLWICCHHHHHRVVSSSPLLFTAAKKNASRSDCEFECAKLTSKRARGVLLAVPSLPHNRHSNSGAGGGGGAPPARCRHSQCLRNGSQTAYSSRVSKPSHHTTCCRSSLPGRAPPAANPHNHRHPNGPMFLELYGPALDQWAQAPVLVL